MKRRMNNFFKKDGKSFVLAMDHAAMMPSPDLKDPGHVIREAVAGGADGFLTTYGIIKAFQNDFGNAGIIMRADGGISALRKPMNPLSLLYTPEDAVRVGADAMLCMGYPGSTDNEHTLEYLANLCAEAEKLNIPVGAEMLPYGFEKHEGIDTRSVENMSFACRQGAELGADFIKAEFVGGERFREVVDGCYAPILVLGGGKAKNAKGKQAIDWSFLRSARFWMLTGLLFFQNAAEQSVNGWMVTYFKGSGIIAGTLAAYTVTVMWGATLVARLLIAFVFPFKSPRKAMVGMSVLCTIFYVLLVMAHTQVMAIVLLFAFAFSMAGLNPTAVASAGRMTSVTSMGIMLPVASSGAILMPWIIGIVAEKAGLAAGMASNIVPCVGLIIFTLLVARLPEE